MEIKEFQNLIWKIYEKHDRRRKIENTVLWFLSEVYEFIEAIKTRRKSDIEEEVADVLAWLASIANLLDIDMEKAAINRYGKGCPKCNSIPCKCPFRERPNKVIRIEAVRRED